MSPEKLDEEILKLSGNEADTLFHLLCTLTLGQMMDLGFSGEGVANLFSIWKKMKERRL